MTRASYTYSKPEGDLEALAHIEAQAFGAPLEQTRTLFEKYRDEVRVLEQGGHIAGALLFIPMGQFFGGRSVSMIGVAGVTTAPQARGRGAATELMRAAVREIRKRGAALSTLYPATYPLYRRVGYEIAGNCYRIRMRARDIGVADRSLDMQPIGERDMRRVHALYRAHARSRQGWLERGPYIWERVRRPRNNAPVHGYLACSDNSPEGYVFYRHAPGPGMGYDLQVTDLVATTGRAARRLLGFLADHRSQARELIWHGGIDDPFVHQLPELGGQLALHNPWMVRIIDVARALGERGYGRDIDTRLELRVTDDLLRANHGRFVVDIAGGRAEVRKGGRGSLTLDIRALAALYTGHLGPHQLAAMGRVEASSRVLDRAATVFAGPAPSLPDFF